MQSNQAPILTPEYPVGKKPSGPWGFWPTVGFGLIIGFAYVVSQVLVVGIFAAKNFISNPGVSSSQLMNSLTNGNVLTAVLFVSTVIGACLTVLFIKIRKGISFKEYLVLNPVKVRTFFLVFGIAVVLLIIAGFVTSGLNQSKFTDQMVQAYQTSSMPVLIWIAVVIFSPVFEEMFFRGFLFAGFNASKVGVTGAIFITAVLWALSHATQYSVWELLVIFGVGVVFGIVRWKTKSLFASLTMHSLWNLLSMIQTVLYIQGRIH